MQTPLSALLRIRNILFLSQRESAVRADVSALRSLDVRSITHEGQSSAAHDLLLRGPAPDLIVLDEQLADCSAFSFLHRLSTDPALARLPVLVLAASTDMAAALRDAGVHTLVRPYAAADLADTLQRAASPMRMPLNRALFDAVTARRPALLAGRRAAKPAGDRPLTTSDWYAKGRDLLARDDLDGAESAFRHVLRRNGDHVEARLSLARIHRIRRDGPSLRRALILASASSLRLGDAARANDIRTLLPAAYREGSIFLHEAAALLEEGDYHGAATGFLAASREEGSPPLHALMARACQFTGNPEGHLEELCDALEIMGHNVAANKIRIRLLHNPEPEYREPSGWLDDFPRLKEVVGVASFAAWAWRHG